jgi:hypothetical protein
MADGNDERLTAEQEAKLRKSLKEEAAGTRMPKRSERVDTLSVLRDRGRKN